MILTPETLSEEADASIELPDAPIPSYSENSQMQSNPCVEDVYQYDLYNLISPGDTNVDIATLMPTTSLETPRISTMELGYKRPRRFIRAPFQNAARTDGLVLKHWVREDAVDQPYPFSAISKDPEIPKFTEEEYDIHLHSADWSKQETMYLLSMVKQFNMRWIIIHDRYDDLSFGQMRSLEDLKERYYAIVGEVQKLRDPNAELRIYDAQHERKRKKQLELIYSKAREEVEEEIMLVNEMERIKIRRQDQEKKAIELQKILQMTDEASASPSGAMKKSQPPTRPRSAQSVTKFNPEVVPTALRFSEFRGAGPHLRSQEMKLPTNVGQKKLKNIEIVLSKLGLDTMPMGHPEVVIAFNELRSNIVLLQELKSTLQIAENDLEAMQADRAANGETPIMMESKFKISSLPEGGWQENVLETEKGPSSTRRLTSYIELSVKAEQVPPRRRRDGPSSRSSGESSSDIPKRTRNQNPLYARDL